MQRKCLISRHLAAEIRESEPELSLSTAITYHVHLGLQVKGSPLIALTATIARRGAGKEHGGVRRYGRLSSDDQGHDWFILLDRCL
jgi:hypothetical protein